MPYLQFKGKTAVETYHYTLPHHALDLMLEQSVLGAGQEPALDRNLIVEGDNLLALKSLLPTHAGRVKCVYIDPPYNTGNEGWVYNDNLTQPQFKEWIGEVVGKEGEDATRHDKWCCMMYPRLMLLKELLREDGVIFVSIDDNEVGNLRVLMDEVFGEENFIAQLVWEKGRKNDAKLFSVGHEYMIVYARLKDLLRKQKTVWREAKPGAQEIWAEYSRLRKEYGDDDGAIEKSMREWYKALPDKHPAKALSRYKQVDGNGPWRDRDISWPGGGGPRYDVPHPVTGKPCRVPERGWVFSNPASMQNQIALGLVVFREDETEPPFRKAHLRPVAEELEEDEDAALTEDDDEETVEVGMQVMPSVIYKQSQVAVRYLRNLMGGKVFENPKDVDVLTRIIRYCTSDDDIILDSFAGSGTTGQAVLEANKADGGNRKFVLVQQPYDNKEQEKKNKNIAETVTAERLRRVIHGYSYQALKNGKKDVEGLHGSFTYARVSDAPLFGEFRDLGERLPAYDELAKYIFYTETSKQWQSTGRDRATNKIGEHGGTSYYLLYTPNHDADSGLDFPFLKETAAADPNPRLVVYCEKFWMHRDELRLWEIENGKSVRSMIVPYNLK
jgi:adenine-specific DNA-methyltransferase